MILREFIFSLLTYFVSQIRHRVLRSFDKHGEQQSRVVYYIVDSLKVDVLLSFSILFHFELPATNAMTKQ